MVRKAVGECTTTRKITTNIHEHFVGGGDVCRGDLCGGDLSGASGGGARRKAAAAGRGVLRRTSIVTSSFVRVVTFTSTEWKHVGVVVEVAHCFGFIINVQGSNQGGVFVCVSLCHLYSLFIGVLSGQKQTLLSKPFSFFKLLSSECCYDVVVR